MRAIAILAVSAVGMLGACIDVCQRGDARCDGNVARNCELGDGAHWTAQACDTSCVVIDGHGATCTLSPTPDPTCTASDMSTACIDDTAVTWTACYRTSETPCSAACIAPTSGACAGFDAFCAESSEPDPLCADVFAACADSATLVQCSCGFRTVTTPCPSSTPSCTKLEDNAECE
ncbi:MAG TPA: hypothetical protein VLX92_19025 [Kofleriaceae bacterium]|nr:hypothetical protein [Kofleriaceae bacterium]